MRLLKVRRAAQITLPAEIREALDIAVGDYLEAEVTEAGLLLKPVDSIDRRAAKERLAETLERRRYVGPDPEPG